MTAGSSQRHTGLKLNAAIQPSPTQVLAGGGVAFLLAFCFFAIVWLHCESVFRSHPLLALPALSSMVATPTFLFVSIRRMTEIGVRGPLVACAVLSATAIGLVALMFLLSLQHLAGA